MDTSTPWYYFWQSPLFG